MPGLSSSTQNHQALSFSLRTNFFTIMTSEVAARALASLIPGPGSQKTLVKYKHTLVLKGPLSRQGQDSVTDHSGRWGCQFLLSKNAPGIRAGKSETSESLSIEQGSVSDIYKKRGAKAACQKHGGEVGKWDGGFVAGKAVEEPSRRK
jgi:hypothetical protein